MIPKRIISQLKKINGNRIFIQFPEGLKYKILDIAKELEACGFECVLCMEPTYGACDVRDSEASLLGCNGILHVGHTDFGVKSKLPVVYWKYFIDIDPLPIVEKKLNLFKGYKTLGIACSLQYCKVVRKLAGFLRKNGYKVMVPKGEKYPGQILGCRQKILYADKKVDAWIVVSAGKFHALGLALASKKPVHNLDLEAGKVYSMKELKQKTKKIMEWNKSLLAEANTIGIIVSWKKGQMIKPYKVKKKLEKMGKKIYLLAFDEVKPDKLEGLKLDLLINTACPRVAIDDIARFKVPIINFFELKDFCH